MSASRAASSDAGTALDTGGSPDPAPPFGQRCGFALGLLADRKERTGSEESIELSCPSSNRRRSQLGGFVPGQRSPARDVGTRLFRCDERHERIITRGRSAKAKALIRGDASARRPGKRKAPFPGPFCLLAIAPVAPVTAALCVSEPLPPKFGGNSGLALDRYWSGSGATTHGSRSRCLRTPSGCSMSCTDDQIIADFS